jgi:hypothetical protein
VETVFCVGVMAACIIALAPPRSLRRVWAADVKEGIPRTACWLAHVCPYPCIACLLAKSLTAMQLMQHMHAQWCPAAASAALGRVTFAHMDKTAMRHSIGQRARCSETLVKER